MRDIPYIFIGLGVFSFPFFCLGLLLGDRGVQMDRVKKEDILLGIVYSDQNDTRDWTAEERNNILQNFFDMDWQRIANTSPKFLPEVLKKTTHWSNHTPIWIILNDKIFVVLIDYGVWDLYMMRKSLLTMGV